MDFKSDDNDVHVSVSSHSRFDALPEEEEGDEEGDTGKWDVHNLPQLYSSFPDVPQVSFHMAVFLVFVLTSAVILMQ